ncbi:MAG: starch-binding protein [Duncaniella sp.]|nr:starch-binding protein [Duncaniella sp.]
MKKTLLLCMFAVLGILVGSAKTVYFERPSGVTQSTTINIYTWGGSPEQYPNGTWPGSPISGSTETIDGKTYIVEVISDAAEKLIFNWNGGQTSNLIAADNAVYNNEGRIGTVVNNHFVAYEEPKIRYYFLNADNWNKVYIHTWEPSAWGLGWPGKELTETETLADGKDYYYAEVNESNPLQNMIFNSGDGKQTGNIQGASVVPFGIYNPSGYANITKDDLQPAVGDELYFYNDLNWSTVYAYVWSGEGDNVVTYNGSWPGNAITATKTVNDKEVFVVEFANAEKIIFSCFDDSHNHTEAYDWEKTRDLEYIPGTMYVASTAVIDNRPEKLYVIGGGTGWDINSEDVDLTTDTPDSYIYTGDVKVTGEEFRIYSNHDGDWNTGSYGSGAPNGQFVNVTFTKGSYTAQAHKDNQGNWKFPEGYKDKVVKFSFDYLAKTFTVYDPTVITVKELLAGEAPVAPAEGDYENAEAFKAAGDDDGLATVKITLEAGVHVNRECTAPAILYNDGNKVFEVSAMADPKDILDNNKIGIHAISGNSFDGGTDNPTDFEVVFSNLTEDVIVYKGENELRFPDGFFMLGGEREILKVEIEGENGPEEVEYENWTGGTPVKGASFVWNVAEAARPAVTPIPFIEDADDEVETSETGVTLSINRYGEHEYYAHVVVKEVGKDDPVKELKSGKGAKSVKVTGLSAGRMHEVTYHYHAYDEAENVDKENWVRDHNAVPCEGTLDALTHPTADVTFDTAGEPDDNGDITYSCTMKLGAGNGVTILYAFDDSMDNGVTDEQIAAIMNPETPAAAPAREGVVAKSGINKYEVTEENPTVQLSYKAPVEEGATGIAVKNVTTMAVYPKADGTFITTPVKAKEVKDDTTMIEEVVAENGNAEFYNLQGQRVNNPEKGIYIMVKGGKAQKVAVK